MRPYVRAHEERTAGREVKVKGSFGKVRRNLRNVNRRK